MIGKATCFNAKHINVQIYANKDGEDSLFETKKKDKKVQVGNYGVFFMSAYYYLLNWVRYSMLFLRVSCIITERVPFLEIPYI